MIEFKKISRTCLLVLCEQKIVLNQSTIEITDEKW